MDSFLRWIGGKKFLRKQILEQFPDEKLEKYIEVFGGAGWILFSKDRHAKIEIFNDINHDLINLFRCVKYHCEAVQKELEYCTCSRELFFDSISQLSSSGLTDIQRAARYFIIIKQSFGAGLKSFATNKYPMNKHTTYLSEIAKRLETVIIENEDFEQLIKTYDREHSLFYLDPPYYKTEKYYKNQFSYEDHERLRDSLAKIKGKFILSYNNDDYIRKLYSDFNILEIDRRRLLEANSNSQIFKEIIVKNF